MITKQKRNKAVPIRETKRIIEELRQANANLKDRVNRLRTKVDDLSEQSRQLINSIALYRSEMTNLQQTNAKLASKNHR